MTSKLLGTTDVPLTHDFHVPHTLASLSGTWTGYYSYHGSPHRLDHAMHMTLSASESARADGPLSTEPSAILSPQGTRLYKLRGTGTDGLGKFTIEGFVWSTGEVCFMKLYVNSYGWVYRGRLLPWGIAGAWNWNRGTFWIWKDEQEILA